MDKKLFGFTPYHTHIGFQFRSVPHFPHDETFEFMNDVLAICLLYYACTFADNGEKFENRCESHFLELRPMRMITKMAFAVKVKAQLWPKTNPRCALWFVKWLNKAFYLSVASSIQVFWGARFMRLAFRDKNSFVCILQPNINLVGDSVSLHQRDPLKLLPKGFNKRINK